MKKIKRFFKETLGKTSVMRVLASTVLLILIFFFISASSDTWTGWLNLIIRATRPFLIGYLIAYILSPFVHAVEKRTKKRGLSILIVMACFMGLLGTVVFIAVPSIFVEVNTFARAGIDGITALINFLNERSFFGLNELMKQLNIDISSYISIKNISSFIAQMVSSSGSVFLSMVFGFINAFFSFLFYTVLAIYFLTNEEGFKKGVLAFADMIDDDLPLYLINASAAVRKFLGSFGVVMLSKAPMYMFLYFIFGHRSWFILGVLNMFAILVPYIGPIAVNILALLTALSQGPFVIFGTLFTIGWSSFVDQYYIEPKIYGTRVKINPLLLLFGIFVNGTLFGLIGVVVAIPMVLVIRSIIMTYYQLKNKKTNDVLEEEAHVS